MTSIALLVDTELIGGEYLTTSKLLDACVSNPPEGGFGFDEMYKRFHLKGVIAAAGTGTELDLEDADFNTAKTCVNAMKWAVLSPFVFEFVKSFN